MRYGLPAAQGQIRLNQDMLQEREIFDLPVVDGDGQLLGVIHLHPALKALLHS